MTRCAPFSPPQDLFERLRDDILMIVIVRPGVLTTGEKRGRFRHGRHVGGFLPTVRISRANVADFMLNRLASDTYLPTAPGVRWSVKQHRRPNALQRPALRAAARRRSFGVDASVGVELHEQAWYHSGWSRPTRVLN